MANSIALARLQFTGYVSAVSRFALPASLMLLASGLLEAAEPLRSVEAVRALSPHAASFSVPVQIEAVVTFYEASRNDLYVHDGQHGIYVGLPPDFGAAHLPLKVGTKLAIQGVTIPGAFLPSIVASRVNAREVGPPPEPKRPAAGELFTPALDCEWVEVSGVIKTIARKENRLVCGVEIEGAPAQVSVWGGDPPLAPEWFAIERAFRLRGVAATVFNDRRQMIGRQFHVPSFEFLTPETGDAPGGAPRLVKLDELLRVDGRQDERARVRGVVTAIRPGAGLFLRGEGGALLVRAAQPPPLEIGDEVEAEGYPEMADVAPNLRATTVRKTGAGKVPSPTPLQPGKSLSRGEHHDLVRVEGELLEIAAGKERATLVCKGEGRVFEAIMDAPSRLTAELMPGEKLQLTGICVMRGDLLGFPEPMRGFTLQLRSPADLVVLSTVPFWTAKRVVWLAAAVCSLAALVAAWALALRRQVRRQTEIIRAKVHRESVLEERERIARELHDTLEQELLGVNMLVDHAMSRMKRDNSNAGHTLALAASMLRHCREESRTSIRDLRSVALENGDLRGALEELLRPLATLHGAEYRVETEGTPRRFSATIETAILRLAHEAVANASRHSGAKHIVVELRYEAESALLRVRDDGSGFDPDSVADIPGHFGLRGMRERARKAGLDLRIASAIGAGTTVTVSIPSA